MKKTNNKNKKNYAKNFNATTLKLINTPLKSAQSLKDAQRQIHLLVWRRLEEARAIDKMIKQESYKFWHEEFTNGITFLYVEENDSSLF
jgi:hypothetical protein